MCDVYLQPATGACGLLDCLCDDLPDNYTREDVRDDAAITSWEIRHDLGEA